MKLLRPHYFEPYLATTADTKRPESTPLIAAPLHIFERMETCQSPLAETEISLFKERKKNQQKSY